MSLERTIKYSLPFFAFVIVSRAVEEISFLYYAVPVMCLMYLVLVLKGSKFKVQNGDPSLPLRMTKPIEVNIRHPESGIQYILFLLPGLWFLLTSLWSPYPEISAARALYFILIASGSIAAGMLWVRYSGRNILDFLLPVNMIVVLVCLFSVTTVIPADSWTGGHGKGFMGFFGHQNALACVLLFTLPSVFFKLLQLVKSDQLSVNSNQTSTKSQPTTNYLLLTTYYLPLSAYSLLLTANLLLLTLTYSRASILALLFGAIVFLISAKKWKVISFYFGTAAVISIIIYFTPSLNEIADKLIKKDFPEFYSSRIWMWEPSYRAAINGGLTGLGYGISDPDIKPSNLGDHYEGERFVREKGNSVLALIEEAGLVGLILFILPIIYLFIKLPDARYRMPDVKDISGNRDPVSSILLASLAAFILHAQFEAWWVGVGSIQLPLFFIYLGLLTKCKINPNPV